MQLAGIVFQISLNIFITFEPEIDNSVKDDGYRAGK